MDLKFFLAVARHGSTLRAAKVLNVSQSTVHRRLEELEKRIGHRLTAPNPGGYKLTELGADMVAYAVQVEAAVLRFERRIAGSNMVLEGSVKITWPEAVGIRLIGSALMKKFNEQYPKLYMEFVISDKLLDLAKGEADIAIRGTHPTDEKLFGRKIADTAWALYVNHDYLRKHGKPADFSELNRHAIVSFDVELAQHVSNQWLKTVAPNARVGARCNSIAGVISAAKSGVGLTALPVVVGDGDGEPVRVLGPIPELTTHFYLLMHADLRHSPRVKACFDFLIDNLAVLRPLLGGGRLKA